VGSLPILDVQVDSGNGRRSVEVMRPGWCARDHISKIRADP
jgi:hypothetical protein